MARGSKQEPGKGSAEVSGGAIPAREPAGLHLPSDLQPWRDRSLPLSDRIAAYKEFVHEQLKAIGAALEGVSGDFAKQRGIRDAPETKRWFSEAHWVGESSPEEFCQRMDSRPPLEIGEEMVASYYFDKNTGASTFTIPAGVTDIEAMKGVNEYFKKHPPQGFRKKYLRQSNGEAICKDDFAWYEKNLPLRDSPQAREIVVVALVTGTAGKDRSTQAKVLHEEGFSFSDNRDQALAAALHACKNNGEDLFQGKWVRGSVPAFVAENRQDFGVRVTKFLGDDGFDVVAASGSPSPESK